MARQLTLSQAFQGMILEKQAAGYSVNTIAEYRYTRAKVLIYFKGDPQFAAIPREQLVKFFAWFDNEYISRSPMASRPVAKSNSAPNHA